MSNSCGHETLHIRLFARQYRGVHGDIKAYIKYRCTLSWVQDYKSELVHSTKFEIGLACTVQAWYVLSYLFYGHCTSLHAYRLTTLELGWHWSAGTCMAQMYMFAWCRSAGYKPLLLLRCYNVYWSFEQHKLNFQVFYFAKLLCFIQKSILGMSWSRDSPEFQLTHCNYIRKNLCLRWE